MNKQDARKHKDPAKWVKILTACYLIPFGEMVLFNIWNSLLRTTYFDLYSQMETARYRWDNVALTAVFTAAILLILFFIWDSKWFDHIQMLPVISITFGTAISLLTVLLVRGIAITDGATVSEIAAEFMQGNYKALQQGEYLFNYSFQIGLVAFLEVLYHITGVRNDLAFQILNVIAIFVFLMMLSWIARELFEEKRVQKLEALLSMGMLPLFLFSTFVYGDIIGWAFGISAVYAMLRYLKEHRAKWLCTAAVCLSVGSFIKSNINILLVAIVIGLVLDCLMRKKWKPLFWIWLLVLLPQLLLKGTESIYAKRAGLEAYPKGIPKIAWVAMSMQEGDEGGYACGWYNAYNWVVYEENHYDREETGRACMENLKGSLKRFVKERRFALNYFYKKFTSQWNAPTFQSLISNEWSTRHHENTTALGHWFLFERGRDILEGIMNVYHFLLFLLVGIYMLCMRKNWSLSAAYFVLNIFGGFFFHMIWEAQSRYVLGYFVMLLPLAAWGLNQLFERVRQRNQWMKGKEQKREAA